MSVASTFSGPAMTFTQTSAAVALTNSNSADAHLSGSVELIGQDTFSADVIEESALAWAASATNLNTTCEDAETCKWYFDGYVMNAQFADSGTSCDTSSGTCVFAACVQEVTTVDDVNTLSNYECVSGDDERVTILQSIAPASWTVSSLVAATPPYGWLNLYDSSVTGTALDTTGFGDFYQTTTYSSGTVVSGVQITQYLASENDIDDSDGFRWEVGQTAGVALMYETNTSSSALEYFQADAVLAGSAPGMALAAAAIVAAGLF